MNSNQFMTFSAKIAGMLAATLLASAIISGIIYAFKYKKVKKENRRELFYNIMVPTAGIVFIIELLMMLASPHY